MKGYPRWFRNSLYAGALALLATGVLMAPATLDLRIGWAMPWHLEGSPRLWVSALHAALAFFTMMQLGALWSVHMRTNWRHHLQRGLGGWLAATLLLLAITALGIYYLPDETWANGFALVHLGAGATLAVPFVWHAWRGRQLRKAPPARRPVRMPTRAERPTVLH